MGHSSLLRPLKLAGNCFICKRWIVQRTYLKSVCLFHNFDLEGWMGIMSCLERCFRAWMLSSRLKLKEVRGMENQRLKFTFHKVENFQYNFGNRDCY